MRITPFLIATALLTSHCLADTGPYLFIDDHWIAKSTGLTRRVNQPVKHPTPVIHNPTFGVTQPFVTVLRDPDTGKLRMWYCRTNELWCATSDDGVHWTDPRVAYARKRGYGAAILDDLGRDPDPARRYKLADWESTPELDDTPQDDSGMYITFSPDNQHWTRATNGPVLPSWPVGYRRYAEYCVSDIIDAFYDPIHRRYAAAVKLMGGAPGDPWSRGTRVGRPFTRRIIGMTFSSDFVHWEKPWRIIVPDERDQGDMEFYCLGGVHARGGLLIGFVRALRDELPCDPGGPPDGIGWTTLAWSRDGRRWTRDVEPLLDRNPKHGTWDHAMTWGSSAIQIGDELFIYYGGYARGHKVEPMKERQIGLARMPVDRYVSLQAETAGGTLLTVPMEAGGQSLVVNADVARDMRIRVLNENGAPVPGFDWTNCSVVRGDSVAHRVKWDGGTQLPPGRVQLEFELKEAKLFAFYFSTNTPQASRAAQYVVPMDWSRFKPYDQIQRKPRELTDCTKIFLNTIRYNLGWATNAIGKLDGRIPFAGLESLNGRGAHDFIRPCATMARGGFGSLGRQVIKAGGTSGKNFWPAASGRMRFG
jgi:hypothetical protein